MKISLVSDELYPVHQVVITWLKEQGYDPILFGALKSGQNEDSWALHAYKATQAIRNGEYTEGIFFCWTGTGISIAANKMPGIRAALCTDATTARGARIWNHANVLALSNRLLSQNIAAEILTAWFEDFDAQKGAVGVNELKSIENTIFQNKNHQKD